MGTPKHPLTEYTDVDALYPHLPAEIKAGIEDYEERILTGKLTFDGGEFADEPPDRVGGWVYDNLVRHLPVLDVEGYA